MRLVQGEVGTRRGRGLRNRPHSDGAHLMFYVVLKGLKHCMTYSDKERKINHVYLEV